MATLTWNPGINSYSPYVKLYVTQKSQSISGNYTILEYSLKLYRPRQIYSSASKSYNIKINGTTVKSGSTTIGGSGTKTIASGTTKVYHNSNGTKKNVAISFYQEVSITWSGVATGNASKSGTMDLTTIPRYAKITSLYANNIRGTQFKINYATDKTIDNVDYSLNGGSWQDTHNSSSYFYITGLKPGTRYTVKIRVRSKDSGLWTTSGTITITTVGLSTSNEPDFDTDGNLTINISRKSTSMYHDLYLYFWHDEQRWEEIARISNVTTKGIFNFTSTQLNEIYNGRVQSNKSNTRLKIVSKWGSNGTVQGTTYEYGELTIVNANPSIDEVTYKDTDTNVQAILNNNQLILRNKSYLEVTAGTASSQKGATLKSYKLSIGGNEYSIATSGTSETGKKIYWGPLDQSSNQTAVLTVIDSRGNKASRSFTIQVINYYEPEPVNYSADRLNNYEESSYINAELRRSVVNINGNDINELYIRYSVDSGSTTSATGNNSYKNGTWQHIDINEFIGDYPNDKSFSVYLEIKDKFSNWLTITMDLPEGIALLSFLKDKIKAGVPFENLAIGKSYEEKAILEVGGTIDSLGYKGPIVPERIPSGADLNDYQEPGMYFCNLSADAATIANTPENIAFSLLVERHAGVKQTFSIYYRTAVRTYYRNFYSGQWGEWFEVSTIEEKGVNANGGYIRHVDGTQICWYENTGVDIGGTSVYTEQGIIKSYRGGFKWTYPANFVGIPNVVYNGDTTVGGTSITGRMRGFRTYSITTVDVGVQIVSFSDFDRWSNMGLIAIGRWK